MMKTIRLNNDVMMPALGFGTMTIDDVNKMSSVLKDAFEEGYRLFDCAEIYGNEEIVGKALRIAEIPRNEIFLTTKVWFTHYEKDQCTKAVMASMKRL